MGESERALELTISTREMGTMNGLVETKL